MWVVRAEGREEKLKWAVHTHTHTHIIVFKCIQGFVWMGLGKRTDMGRRGQPGNWCITHSPREAGASGPGGHGEKQPGWGDAAAGQVPATVSRG